MRLTVQAAPAGATVQLYLVSGDAAVGTVGTMVAEAPAESPETTMAWTPTARGQFRLRGALVDGVGNILDEVEGRLAVRARPRITLQAPVPLEVLQGSDVRIVASIEGEGAGLAGAWLRADDADGTWVTRIPYQWVWKAEALGWHELVVMARDERNPPETGRSETLRVRVRTREPFARVGEAREQFVSDLFGREAVSGDPIRTNGESVEAYVGRLMGTEEGERLRRIVALHYLLRGWYPSRDDLVVREVAIQGEEAVRLTGWAGVFSKQQELEEAGLPEGLLGLACGWLRDAEGLDRELFASWWERRHGRAPTAQQVVQATNRMAAFAVERPASVTGVTKLIYGRARLACRLVEEAEGLPSPVIYNPPPDRLRKASGLGWAQAAFWRVGMPNPSAWEEWASEAGLGGVLKHPRTWRRFTDEDLEGGETADGWKWTPLGLVYAVAGDFPWVWRQEGAVFLHMGEGGAAWQWRPEAGWEWTSGQVHPWVYRLGVGWRHGE